ncbi:related to Rotein of unknown function [Rhynchosporium agropyri]|uniref:YMC020W-like alpha/beta hydrolase domain-containing protein n=1 Tax=Rhynchosporium agropyri TaxID=914238 RepID=A0A1E1KG42_9HELO|nr:related to Rotein of unknown function [Rhynchosporium agropyri]
MGSLRKSKRARTKPPSVDEPANGSTSTLPQVEDSPSTATPSTSATDSTKDSSDKRRDAPNPSKGMRPEASASRPLNTKGSWYGTWPRKAVASTQVARESILADKPTNSSTVDLSRFEAKKNPTRPGTPAARPPSMYLGKSKETLDITMGEALKPEGLADKDGKKGDQLMSNTNNVVTEESQKKQAEASEVPSQPKTEQDPVRPSTASGWLGAWLSRPTATTELTTTSDKPSEAVETVNGSSEEQVSKPAQVTETIGNIAQKSTEQTAQPATQPLAASWFGLWSTAAPSTAAEAPDQQLPVKVAESDSDTVMGDASAIVSAESPTAAQILPAVGSSSWAFWSTEPTKTTNKLPETSVEPGQLAVAGEASEDKPEPAKTAVVKSKKKDKTSKRARPQSAEVAETAVNAIQPQKLKATSSTSNLAAKTAPPNLLIPSVRNTYRLVENPSILQQITRLILHGHQQPVKHVFLTKERPKIKKALAIGIHGLFPAPLLRTVIGQPTGTSIRFAKHASDAIRRWADKNGSLNCEIEKIALEGEGKIAERVDNLWKLLLNWIDHVRKADFILIACHSQGVPVAMMLIAKLIEFGVVTSGRIGVCAMAGVSLGPFADYKSRLFSGSAGELFEFANTESTVSKRYEDSLKIAVKYGVRITYCGSIDDQLVSMESSIFSTVSHPYIFRAVFVDGRIHAPDFLSHLVGFALKLRNLGVSDHGLIRELSAPLAGSLYTGEGHSRLYDDGNVYDLAVEYALETTSVDDVPLDIKKYEIPTNANPYLLPWIMRGLLEEDFVKTELDQETTQLLKQFDDWKPATKVLKDVKYRLEAVRSKL